MTDRCVDCGEFLGVGDSYYCPECDDPEDADVPEEHCDGCGKRRALIDLGFGWFCDDCANDVEEDRESCST